MRWLNPTVLVGAAWLVVAVLWAVTGQYVLAAIWAALAVTWIVAALRGSCSEHAELSRSRGLDRAELLWAGGLVAVPWCFVALAGFRTGFEMNLAVILTVQVALSVTRPWRLIRWEPSKDPASYR